MGSRARAGLAMALLLAAAPGAAAPAQAQGAAPPPGPFEPLPPELLAVAFRWLDEANASIAAARREDPGLDARVLLLFRDGAWDFLNESRVTLAMTQLLHVHADAKLPFVLRNESAEARKARAVEAVKAEANASRAALDAIEARLASSEPALRTAHAAEYALLAGIAALAGEAILRNAPPVVAQLEEARFAEESLVRAALAVTATPSLQARWAQSLLDLAERAGRDASRPPLPEGGVGALAAAVEERLERDPDSRSLTGPSSSLAWGALQRANASEGRVLRLARFLEFEQARTADALDFLAARRELTEEGLAARARLLAGNASFAPRYDAQLEAGDWEGLVARVRAAGYAGVLQVDAWNHLLYAVTFDPSFRGVGQAWAHLVAARYAGEALAEVPSPRPQGSEVESLLLGGLAVAAALAVVAFAALRRPRA